MARTDEQDVELKVLDVEISVGEDDLDRGLKLGVDGEPFWRVHITPEGEILVGDGFTYPLEPYSGGAAGTDAEDVALADVPGNWTSTDLEALAAEVADAFAGKQDASVVLTNTTASFTTAQETKLAGIATAATANDTDANLKNRANHTGTQAISTVADLQTTLDAKVAKGTFPVVIGVALSDETTAITTGAAKATIRSPFAFTLTAVRANVNTASSSGLPTVDINEEGTTLLSTKLTIDANEKSSVTAATPAVISDSAIADDAEITFDIDVAGTGAKGLKVWLIGTRTVS
jgi:hypothetical protein